MAPNNTVNIHVFVSTKKALMALLLAALCLTFQGFFFVLFSTATGGLATFQDGDGMQQELIFLDINNKAPSLRYVRRFEDTKRSLNFFHVPKTAGTAIEHVAGDQQGLAWGSCRFNHKPKRDVCRYPRESFQFPKKYGWWHLPSFLFPLGGYDPYKDSELFAVIRDPCERLVSEFYYICQLKVFSWRPDQCDRSRLFEHEYMNEWLQHKLKEKNFNMAESYLQDNGHFTPQYDFLVNKHGVRMVDYVLQMEHLDEQFEKLMGAFSMDIRMAKHKMNAARDGSDHLGVDDLDDVTIAAAHKVFPHDFDLSLQYIRSPVPQM